MAIVSEGSEMTTEELYEKVDGKLSKIDQKLDKVSESVVRHDENIAACSRDTRDLKDRVSKLERWMWFSFGAGGATGAGLAKVFLS